MTTTTTGYLLCLRQDRLEPFERCLVNDAQFEEPVPRYAQHPRLCFISARPGWLTHLARRVPRVSRYAGTELSLITCECIRALSLPINIGALFNAAKVRADVRERVVNVGGYIAEGSCQNILDAIIADQKDARKIVDEVLSQPDDVAAPQAVKSQWALQRDVFALLLEIIRLDRSLVMADWTPPPFEGAQAPSYPQGLVRGAYLREFQMTLQDATNFPGFDLLSRRVDTGFEFSRGEHRIRVLVTDRTMVEFDGGMDLLYLNERYRSFVAVQYKVIDETYYPDQDLAKQIRRMHTLGVALEGLGRAVPTTPPQDGFRLHDNPFFLKFCPRVATFDRKSADMIRGQYVALPFWETIVETHRGGGGKTALAVREDTIPRHLDNTHFIELLRNAWVGSTPRQYAGVQEVIQHILNTGRSWAIAHHTQIHGDRSTSSKAHAYLDDRSGSDGR